MKKDKIHLFVLGSTGFVGTELVKYARAEGLLITALARSAEKASGLDILGARIVIGDAMNPDGWIHEAVDCDVMLDLLQPEIPGRVGERVIQRAAAARSSMTSRLLTALETIPQLKRPLLLSVSGLDDLLPDERGNVDARSPLSTQLAGFGYIGVSVRRLIEASGVRSAYAYLGTVYGPGKSFARKIFPQLAAGRMRLPGKADNRMALVHVEDAARALVHVAKLETERYTGRSYVIADGYPVTMAEFIGFAAECIGGPRPKSVPRFIARAIAGGALFQTMTRDIAADPAALTGTGFEFKYPTYRQGLPPSVRQLGYPRGKSASNLPGRPRVFIVMSVFAIGALIAENLLFFPLSVPYMTKLAAGAHILDMRPWYTPQAAYQLFDVLGKSGRNAYLTLLWTLDLLLPALFGTFLSMALRRGAFRTWHWVPLLAAAFDYAENIAITSLLLRYPEHHPAVVRIAATFTAAKLGSYGTGVLLSLGGMLAPFLSSLNDKPLRSRPQ